MKFALIKLQFVIVVALIFCVQNGAKGQEVYPLTRDDSANVVIYQEQYETHLRQNHKKEASRFLNLMAMIYWEKNHYKQAENIYLKSLKLNEELANENGIAMLNNNLAMICADMGAYKKSLEYFDKTLVARRVSKEKIGMISALINQSVVYNRLQDYDNSIKNLKEALDIARELNDPDQMKSCYGMLSETYEKAGNSEQSLYYYNYFKTFNDIVTNEKIKKSQVELQNEKLQREVADLKLKQKQYELTSTQEKLSDTEHEVEVINEEKDQLTKTLTKQEMKLMIVEQESEIEHLENLNLKHQQEIQSKVLWLVSLVLIAIAAFFGVLLYFFRQKQKLNKALVSKNEKIEEQRNSIQDSINYAQHIQGAMLTREQELNEIIPDSFVIYKPKDVVSGDFYWYSSIGDKIILVVADCTGHGVPGGFITMVGNNLLTQIIEHQNILEPHRILHKLDEGIINTFSQNHTQNKDGMDAAVVVIDKANNTMSYAGANSAIIIITGDDLNYVKPDKFGIGGAVHKSPKRDIAKEFNTIEFDLSDSGQSVYLFSDGVVDQFDSSGEKKFMRKRLKETLLSCNTKDIQERGQHIEQTLNDWMRNAEQTDDITLLGLDIKN